MGLNSEMEEQMSYYPTLTQEEKARMHPCKRAKCVMMPGSSPPISSSGYVELPDEPRAGKIMPLSNNSSPSPRPSKSDEADESTPTKNGEALEEAIEEAVPVVHATLPKPEPRPLIERNGFKEHDRVDGVASQLNNGLKPKPATQHDVDDDSCLIKCVYFTQQCCECSIV